MELYSEKLGKLISLSEEIEEMDNLSIIEDVTDSLVGSWCHGGWSRDSGNY